MAQASALENPIQPLLTVAAQSGPAVIALPENGSLRYIRTRFVRVGAEGFWLEIPQTAIADLQTVCKRNTRLAVSFRAGDRRFSFVTYITKMELTMQVDSSTQIPAVQIAMPAEIQGVQRRGAYRVRIRDDHEIDFRLWLMPLGTRLEDRPIPSQEARAELIDLSVGGAGVVLCPRDRQPQSVEANQRVRVRVIRQDVDVVLEGELRLTETTSLSEQRRVGIRFSYSRDDLDERRAKASLAKILGDVQRDEVRRTHLGLVG